jgi:hypothetical protein
MIALFDNCFPFGCNFVQRLVPADALELLAALGAGAAHREQQTIRVIMAFLIIFQFDAQASTRHRMVLVAAYARQFSVFNLKDHGTGVGTIMGTGTVKFLAAGFGLR